MQPRSGCDASANEAGRPESRFALPFRVAADPEARAQAGTQEWAGQPLFPPGATELNPP